MKVKLLLVLISLWLGPSMLIDFVAAPSIFRNISDIQEAGTLGMIIFKSFNSLEFVISILILVLGSLLIAENKIKKIWITLFSVLVIFASFLRFYVSPQIIDINTKRYELSESSKEFKRLSGEHQFYHELYVNLEATKVILLLVGLIMVIRIKEEEMI